MRRDSFEFIRIRLWLTCFLLVVLSITPLGLRAVKGEPVPAKPSENHYVFDYAGLIDANDLEHMKNIARTIEQKTKAQVAVVIVNDLSDLAIEDYALSILRDWGIGDKEKNNGVLILVNKESVLQNQSGRIRIEVGYGLEGAINDGKAGAILDNYALPAFEGKQYSKGITDTFLAVSSEIAKEYDLDLSSEGLSELDDYRQSEDRGISREIIKAILVFILIIILTSMFPPRRGRQNYRRSPFSGPFGGGGGFGSGGFGGFGGSSGGSFGGRSSFGGGSGGGGGASR